MKILVSDFDRTLYINGEISKRNLTYLKLWKERGNIFIIATGRDIESIKSKLAEFNIYCDYYICNNGGAIYDNNSNAISYKFIDKSISTELINHIYEKYPNSIGITELDGKSKILSTKGIDNQKNAEHILEIDGLNQIDKLIQIHKKFDNFKDSINFCMDINNIFSHSISAYCNNLNVDVVSKDINKSYGVKYLKRLINTTSELFVIGDSYNDVKMIQDFNGYTLNSAIPAIKNLTENIVDEVADIISKNIIS